MDLMHLIKNYYYLKFFVDVYDEYISLAFSPSL